MRLFIGSFLDKELVECIPFDEIQKLFEDDLKNIKRENVHMTWVFLGNVDGKNLLPLQKAIENQAEIFKGLSFRSLSLEFWPPKKYPRLIVLAGNMNKDIDLTKLSTELQTICSPDIKQDFLPHITVARFKKDKTINREIELPGLKEFVWQIKEVSLIQSTLTSQGPNYETLYNLKL